MNEDIITTLNKIEKRLESIEQHLGIVKQDCEKMGKHIDFVHTIYSILRKPLNYFISTKQLLPKIKNNIEINEQ